MTVGGLSCSMMMMMIYMEENEQKPGEMKHSVPKLQYHSNSVILALHE